MRRSPALAYNEVQLTGLFFESILIYTFQQLLVKAKEISSKEQKKIDLLSHYESVAFYSKQSCPEERQPYSKVEDAVRLA